MAVRVAEEKREWRAAVRSRVQQIPTEAIRLHPDLQKHRHTEGAAHREQAISEIAANWDPNQLGVLVVVPAPEGGYWDIDGGRRLTAARRRGERMLPCLVVEGLDLRDPDQEAYLGQITLGLAASTSWRDITKYDVAVRFGLQPDATIEKILRDNNARGGYAAGPRVYACTQQLRVIYGRGVLFPTVFVIEAAWGHYAHGSMERRQSSAARSVAMVNAVALIVEFYKDHPNFDDNRLADKLSGRSPLALLQSAKANAMATNTSLARLLVAGLVEAYDFGRTGPRRLPPFKMLKRGAG